jgi:CsoR family transcriptional regulator, copper-sensing transcriptional repressor
MRHGRLRQSHRGGQVTDARSLGLLEEHMAGLGSAARAGGPEADARVKEAADAVARLVRS